ncbi:MAG: sigma-70 family RNA polymerase sigma factor [Candidatus Eremiobacteraeota bacterium]|nr:sigma-70 family RNA polymerase sigma factor [Candidatus Eremiobacteraeota bacterium]
MEKNSPPSAEGHDEELFRDYSRSRDPFLRHTLISRHLDLAKPVVRKYRNLGESNDDLLQVAYIGLIKAVDLYDVERGIKFSTFASHWIEGEVKHYLRDKVEMARRPRWLNELAGSVNRLIEKHLQEHQTPPSTEAVSRELNIPEHKVKEVLKAKESGNTHRVSLDEVGEGDLEKSIAPAYESFKLPDDEMILLKQALEHLRLFERKVVFLFFYYDLTQMQIAQRMGISQRKVSRVLSKAVEGMKKFFRAN